MKFIPTPKIAEPKLLKIGTENLIRNIRIRYFFQNNEKTDEKDMEFKLKFHIPNPIWQPPQADAILEKWILEFQEKTEFYIKNLENLIKNKKIKSKLNLSPSEFIALRKLIENMEIVIKPADKNAGITILNRSDYIKFAEKHLSDEKNYKKISEFESQRLLEEVSQLFELIFGRNSDSKTKKHFNFIGKFVKNTKRENISKFYVIPKIHKTPISTRPILASHSATLQNFSTFLAFCAQPKVEKTKLYLKNSREFLKKLRNLKIENSENIFMACGDIDAMYPNINVQKATKICEEIYEFSDYAKNSFSKRHWNLLSKFLLTHNIMEFNNNFYLQINGLPMGAASSPPIAILVVDKMETEKFPSWENDHVILWSRYIDDIFILSNNEEKLKKLLKKYDEMDPKIKVNWKSGKILEFLDISVEITKNGIQTWPFQKGMSIFQYIPFRSFHEPKQKTAWIYAELERYFTISTNFLKWKISRNLFYGRLITRGYPKGILNEIFKKFELQNWRKNEKYFPIISEIPKFLVEIQDPNPLQLFGEFPSENSKNGQISDRSTRKKWSFFLKLEYNPSWENFKISEILPNWKPEEFEKIQISWSNAPNLGKKLIKAKLPEIKIPEIKKSAEEIDPQTKT